MEREGNRVYIGDGIYATWNGWDVTIETERENGTHWIVLEPSAVRQLAEMAGIDLRQSAGEGANDG